MVAEISAISHCDRSERQSEQFSFPIYIYIYIQREREREREKQMGHAYIQLGDVWFTIILYYTVILHYYNLTIM